ncbi:MAG: triose-phosphate isomerase [Flavobacteriaceae bacterium]|nr:triose-phosphate isomerase [Flavobacteriaceae bacterium]|tara:strand:- start:3358 stop:4116 length:759 start_codon:yes stop_codon:yes gene_type:complete
MRKNIIAGNWKMNKTFQESVDLIHNLNDGIDQGSLTDKRIMVAPTFVNLYPSLLESKDSPVEVIAQNLHEEDSGAFTGEVAAPMLTAMDVKTVILGHSERRTLFNESPELLAKKVDKALEHDLEVIFCIGETLKIRKTENHYLEIAGQVRKSLFHLRAEQWKNIIIAYEPVWAIGTGLTATPEQAEEMHQFIRRIIEKKYSSEVAESTSILYGGSVKPNNAEEIFSQPDVDGGLVGGASLNAEDFLAIINSI